MAEIEVYQKTPGEYDLIQRRARKSMRSTIVMFGLMVFFTLVSFSVVVLYQSGTVGFSEYFVIPLIMLIAAILGGLQLFYFMHMNEEGHGTPLLFMVCGILTAFLIILTFVTIVWWN